MSRYTPKKIRTSTRDKFVSILKGGKEQGKTERWYRRKNLFFPLLMIVVFSFLSMALSVISTINEEFKKKSDEDVLIEDMDYETARDILNSSGQNTGDVPIQE